MSDLTRQLLADSDEEDEAPAPAEPKAAPAPVPVAATKPRPNLPTTAVNPMVVGAAGMNPQLLMSVAQMNSVAFANWQQQQAQAQAQAQAKAQAKAQAQAKATAQAKVQAAAQAQALAARKAAAQAKGRAPPAAAKPNARAPAVAVAAKAAATGAAQAVGGVRIPQLHIIQFYQRQLKGNEAKVRQVKAVIDEARDLRSKGLIESSTTYAIEKMENEVLDERQKAAAWAEYRVVAERRNKYIAEHKRKLEASRKEAVDAAAAAKGAVAGKGAASKAAGAKPAAAAAAAKASSAAGTAAAPTKPASKTTAAAVKAAAAKKSTTPAAAASAAGGATTEEELSGELAEKAGLSVKDTDVMGILAAEGVDLAATPQLPVRPTPASGTAPAAAPALAPAPAAAAAAAVASPNPAVSPPNVNSFAVPDPDKWFGRNVLNHEVGWALFAEELGKRPLMDGDRGVVTECCQKTEAHESGVLELLSEATESFVTDLLESLVEVAKIRRDDLMRCVALEKGKGADEGLGLSRIQADPDPCDLVLPVPRSFLELQIERAQNEVQELNAREEFLTQVLREQAKGPPARSRRPTANEDGLEFHFKAVVEEDRLRERSQNLDMENLALISWRKRVRAEYKLDSTQRPNKRSKASADLVPGVQQMLGDIQKRRNAQHQVIINIRARLNAADEIQNRNPNAPPPGLRIANALRLGRMTKAETEGAAVIKVDDLLVATRGKPGAERLAMVAWKARQKEAWS